MPFTADAKTQTHTGAPVMHTAAVALAPGEA